MCNNEKQIFAKTIGGHKATMLKLADKNFVAKTVGEISDDLASRAAQYGGLVKTYVDSGISDKPSSSE